jgi:hypothetical protein
VKALALLLGSLATISGAVLYQDAVDASAESAALAQGFLIADAAFLNSEWGTTNWEDALRNAVDSSRDRENLTLDGTTLTWTAGDYCFTIDLPTVASMPDPKPCS